MATSILQNILLLFHDRDLTCQTNTVGVDFGAETGDDTSFCDDTRSNIGALKTVGFSAEGFADGAMDADLFSALGVEGRLITAAVGKSVGDRAFSLQAVSGSYTPLTGATGDINGYSLNASARGSLQRGSLLFHADSVTASGAGATLNAGSASSQVTAYLHVFSADGTTPTLDVDVESDSADDFTGAESTVLSFTQATGRTAERKTAGSTADTWWRVNYTVGGTNPDFGFAVVLVLE